MRNLCTKRKFFLNMASCLLLFGTVFIHQSVEAQPAEMTSWNQTAKAAASDRAAFDLFGGAVAISGNYAVVGASREDQDAEGSNALGAAGSAYVFELDNDGNWQQVQKIVASDRASRARFGNAVAISGNTLAVAAFRESASVNDAGAVYIFELNTTTDTWEELQKITASDRAALDRFGTSISLSGNTLVVGAHFEDAGSSLARAGSAYIFERNGGGTWVESQKITASDGASGDRFGFSVSVSNNTIVVGARDEQENHLGSAPIVGAGSAYIFENNGGTWEETQKLVARSRQRNDRFGTSVSISGDALVIGAPFEDQDANDNRPASNLVSSGSAYIFERNDIGRFVQTQKITASDRGTGDQFGTTVSISDTALVVGAPFESEDAEGNNTLGSAGSAYVFELNGDDWVETNKITASDRAANDQFGNAVAISGNALIVGAELEDEDAEGSNNLGSAGSVYFFEAASDEEGEGSSEGGALRVSVTPSDASCESLSGGSVTATLTGGTAPYTYTWSDGSVTTGTTDLTNSITGLIPSDYGLIVSDANGETVIATTTVGINDSEASWSQGVKVAASNRQSRAEFGEVVAISGNYAVIGAESADVFNPATFQVIDNAGSAYIFERNALGTWQQAQILSASDADEDDRFGSSVAILGDIAVVGADGGDFVSPNPGAAYIFERNTTTGAWVETQKLTASDGVGGDAFGNSVSISGNTILVGAVRNNDFNNPGSAYIFERNELGVWQETQILAASDEAAGDQFGYAVSISGDALVIGAFNEDEDADGLNTLFNPGSAYVFERDGDGTWIEVAKLVANDRGIFEQFGNSVSISGNTIAIPAQGEDEDADGLNTENNAGAIYIFERDASGNWPQVQKLVTFDREANDNLGGLPFLPQTISLAGNTLAIGAMNEDEDADSSNTLNSAGSVYIFQRNGTGTWAGVQKIVASDRAVFDNFGSSVAISGADIVVGAFREDEDAVGGNNLSSAGSAYFFNVGCSDPTFTDHSTGDALGENPSVQANSLSGLGSADNSLARNLRFYPNPTKGEFNLELGEEYENLNIVVRNALGQQVAAANYINTNFINLDLEGESGLYFVELIANNNLRTVVRVMKQ